MKEQGNCRANTCIQFCVSEEDFYLFDRKEGEKKKKKVSAIFQNSELLMWLEEGGNNKNKGSKSTLGSFKRLSV